MGFKSGKTIHRDEISGLYVQDDGAGNGTYSVNELQTRAEARQAALNAAIKSSWPSSMTSSVPEHTDPSLGNVFSRLPKPSDYVVGSKSERFGSAAEDDSNPNAGGAPQKPAKVAGIEPARKRG